MLFCHDNIQTAIVKWWLSFSHVAFFFSFFFSVFFCVAWRNYTARPVQSSEQNEEGGRTHSGVALGYECILFPRNQVITLFAKHIIRLNWPINLISEHTVSERIQFLCSCTQNERERTSCTAVHRLRGNVLPVQLHIALDECTSCTAVHRLWGNLLRTALYTQTLRKHISCTVEHRLWANVLPG